MSGTACPRCETPLPPNYGPRNCAFKNGTFSEDNWNCGTANALRDIAIANNAATRWADSSIGYVPLPGERGFAVLLWYKHRGAVDSIRLAGSNALISLTVAEATIEKFAADLVAASADKEIQHPYGGRYA